jgi:23S rRNA (guanosine2251-2'-O)-methyltransferase
MRFSPKFLQLLREAKSSGVLVEEVTWARLGQITGGAVHQGIALQTAAAETLDLPTLLEGCAAIGEPALLMAVDGLTDPQNLGAIVRSAEALGAHGLVLPQRRSAGLTGSVAKVAAGALEHLPVARVVNLNRALDTLKQEGYRVVGLAAEGTVSLEEADLEGPLVIVTGSEGDGLSMLTRRNCDQLVRIPLRGATPSLNASVATALLLYEVARRGWMKGLRGSQPAPRLVRPQLPAPAAAVPEPATEDEGSLVLEEASIPTEVVAAEEPPVAAWMPPVDTAPDDEEAPVADAEPAFTEAPVVADAAINGTAAADAPAELNDSTAPVEPLASESTLDLGLTPATPAGFHGDIQL